MKAKWVLVVVVCVAACGAKSPTGGSDVTQDTASPVDAEDAAAEVEVVCVPECDGKDCGDDGCGGLCGTCEDGQYCDHRCQWLVCLPGGDPWCEGNKQWACDDNGWHDYVVEDCSLVGQVCHDGECCPPDCEGKECGDDGCGGWCGWCPGLQDVCTDGLCPCVPDCEGKECGDDGCEGSCGDCSGPPLECVGGVCDCICTDVYQPVCDTLNCETYPNWCEATCAGIVNVEQGPCDCGCTSECTEDEWSLGPVCSTDGITYDSFCELKCSDDDYDNGCLTFEDCPEFDHICIPPPPCPGCPDDYNPVCATNGQTYWNYCCFDCCGVPDGAEYFCQGECVDQATCPDAPMLCEPVCALNDNGQAISYINAQVRDCFEGIPLYDVPCCDGVSTEPNWVCADMTGTLEAFLNSDVLMCTDTGIPVLYEIPQDDQGMFEVGWCEDCQCDLSPAGVAPVCSVEWNTWPNSCVSACEGEEVLCSTPCEACDPP